MGYIAFKGIEPNIGGLCDRLKGLYSCYLIAKLLKRDFCYLLAHADALESKHNPPKIFGAFHHVIDYTRFMLYKDKIEKLDFDPTINHIISINMDITQYIPGTDVVSFGDFIRDVFDIPLFEAKHNIQRFDAGIHVRCGGNLVNWNDYNFGQESNKDDIQKHVKSVCELHESVYICSDSQEVLDSIKELHISNLSITPNIPVHVDRSPEVTAEDYKNVFYDLLTLANCDTIYYTLGDYAKTAARINNKPLKCLYNC